MTYQPPPQPIGYAMPPSRPARPTSVTVLAIIGIIFASLGLLSSICGGIFLLLSSTVDVSSELTGAQQAMYASTAWKVYEIFSYVAWLGISILLMYGSIASLSLKPAGRRAMLLYATLVIILAVLNVIMTLVLLGPTLKPFLSSSDTAEAASAWTIIISGTISTLVGLIYPIFVLVYYRKPHVVAAFEGKTDYGNPYMSPSSPYQPPYPQP